MSVEVEVKNDEERRPFQNHTGGNGGWLQDDDDDTTNGNRLDHAIGIPSRDSHAVTGEGSARSADGVVEGNVGRKCADDGIVLRIVSSYCRMFQLRMGINNNVGVSGDDLYFGKR
jgi:hypothetical protein